MQFTQISMMAVAAAEETGEHGGGESLTSPVFFHLGPLEISEHIFSAWVVMAVLVLIAVLGTRSMQMVPRGLQNVLEIVIDGLAGVIHQTAGSKGRVFAPVVMTAFLFILAANWIGTTPFFGNVKGFKSPNSNLNITAAMAIIVFVLCQFFAIKTLGFRGLPQGVCGPESAAHPDRTEPAAVALVAAVRQHLRGRCARAHHARNCPVYHLRVPGHGALCGRRPGIDLHDADAGVSLACCHWPRP